MSEIAGLPAGFSSRAVRRSDAGPVAELLNEEAIEALGEPVMGSNELTSTWDSPDADAERDFAVVLDSAGELAAYLSIQADPPYTEVLGISGVKTRFHGLGIGTAILRETERRALRFADMAPTGEPVRMHTGALANAPRLSALLVANGYVEVRHFLKMRRLFDTLPVVAAEPAGVEIRTLQAGQERPVYACLVEAFADHWGEGWPSEQVWLHSMIETTDRFRPDLWLLAWDGGRLVAAAIGEIPDWNDRFGYVSTIGVLRSHRGRGIAEALLLGLFARFQAEGLDGVELHVDAESPTGATRLYRRVGMTPKPCFVAWEKTLRAAAG